MFLMSQAQITTYKVTATEGLNNIATGLKLGSQPYDTTRYEITMPKNVKNWVWDSYMVSMNSATDSTYEDILLTTKGYMYYSYTGTDRRVMTIADTIGDAFGDFEGFPHPYKLVIQIIYDDTDTATYVSNLTINGFNANY